MQNLAAKYRPKTFEDVVGQDNIKLILSNQLENNSTKNAYLFVGSQGTGKTTCARIFANEINKGEGNPIEMDAASNSGVDDVRNIIQQAQTKALDSEYKVFIIDECHSISNTGWQAFLKLIEEPPAKSVFIFCTTNPEKIPKTILSRVQRFDFQRISQQDIVKRLDMILENEREEDSAHDINALEYIAKLANGGMRDAITMLDKCLDYSADITLDNVVKALGVADYETMDKLYNALVNHNENEIISIVEQVNSSGKSLKTFIRNFIDFVLDIEKYLITKRLDFITIPSNYVENKSNYSRDLLRGLLNLNNDIKWDSSPKALIEATLLDIARSIK